MAENNFLTDFSDSSSFSDFLETQPQALYQSYLGDPKNNMNASMKRYYQNQFSNIQNEYIGSLARDMRGGKLPTGRFSDYLESNVFRQPSPGTFNPSQSYAPLNRFTGYDRYRKESPYLRNQYGSGPAGANVFAPSARWITY